MNSNLILHIPHASTLIPNQKGYVVNHSELEQEMLLLTDWYTDDLFSFSGGVTIAANFNRIFCDVERFADDNQEVMSTVGMGFAYSKRDDGSELRKVSSELKKEILDSYYYPHHKALTKAVEEQVNLYGKALVIDCHSFSNKPFKRDLSQDTIRPDICIGTDDFHTPRGLYKIAAIFLKLQGYSVKINTPYSGSIVPMEYYQRNKKVYSIMIEVNRDLYLKPGTNQKNDNYDKVKQLIQNLLLTLSRYVINTDIPIS